MFPSPTAEAAAARMNAHLPDQDERAGVPVEDIDNLRCRSINAREPPGADASAGGRIRAPPNIHPLRRDPNASL